METPAQIGQDAVPRSTSPAKSFAPGREKSPSSSPDGPFSDGGAQSSVSTESGTEYQRYEESVNTSLNIDSDKYLLLGSLLTQGTGHEGSEWSEMHTDTLPGSFQNHPLGTQVNRLLKSMWIRVFARLNDLDKTYITLRIHLLPDDIARGKVDRSDKRTRAALRALMVNVDRSREAWDAASCNLIDYPTYTALSSDEDSLFYIFNTLSSPQPKANLVKDQYASEAMREVLDGSLEASGLKTSMYPYQRRSAAEMIRRESAPSSSLDPRLEKWRGPTGQTFYFDRDSGFVHSDIRTFEDARGGILAETMGYGKTLICLATVLATKDTLPEIPADQLLHTSRRGDGNGARSLARMAAGAAARHNVPWKLMFADLRESGQSYDTTAIKVLKEVAAIYEDRKEVQLYRRTETIVQKFHICCTTLVVVPPNLLSQWKEEIKKHLDENAMSILVIEDRSFEMPAPEILADYDMVLMARTRFEEEVKRRPLLDSSSVNNCRCSIARRLCPDHEYRSPLLDCHFLRFIVDEGQGFISSSSSSTTALTGLQSIRVERKWIVSGTPTSGLIGVEVDLAAEESVSLENEPQASSDARYLCPSSDHGPMNMPIQKTLTSRRKNPAFEEEKKDIQSLGRIVKSFLQLKPWANTALSGDGANWNVHVVPNSAGARKPVSLRNVLSSLVIRHRIEDVEVDLQLPPLINRITRLKPSFFDKISINLFTFVLATNAITSERQDQDYMFHPRNRKTLEALIRNLRSSAFFWTGFTEDEIDKTCHAGKKYLENPAHVVTAEDRQSLENAMSISKIASLLPAWQAFSRHNEIGLYMVGLPEDVANKLALCESSNRAPLLVSATRLEAATKVVETNLYASDPFKTLPEDLQGGVDKPKAAVIAKSKSPQKKGSSQNVDPIPEKGIPKSSVQDSLKLTTGRLSSRSSGGRRSSLEGGGKSHKRKSSFSRDSQSQTSILKSAVESKLPIPSAYNELATPKLVGTASAKLSYLLDRIVELQIDEKILVFYEGDYIAYYCAQALEVLGIPHFIYPSGLSLKLRTEYQNMFNSDEQHRVMLMDIKQAALGLHIASASRVFFINPVWQPNIEAQAIKRAHRIGQTKPVYVETLVLEGTIEEQMLERRKNMTTQEHHKASRSLLDDNTMANMIQNIKIIPLTEEEISQEESQYAPIKEPQQVFARSTASQYSKEELNASVSAAKASAPDDNNQPLSGLPSRPTPKKRKIMFADQGAGGGQMDTDIDETALAASPVSSVTPTTQVSNFTRNDDERPDVLYTLHGEPPLYHVAPRRTVKFAEDN